jgi:sterol desaturase/sphingolipid hydroxylase (fatty acid hydroxylase superfamily)
MNLFYGTLLMAILLWAEALWTRWRTGRGPWLEVLANLHSGQTLMWFFRGVELSVYAWVYTQMSLGLLDFLPTWLLWILAFIAWDFCFYWLHRLHHKIPLLWKIHAVHHQGERFDLSLGVRNAWLSSLGSIPFFVGLAWIGIPLEVFVSVAALHYFVQFYNHNGLVKSSGLLESFMVTPSLHRVHHGMNPRYLDRNFGGTLNIWDRFFGTRQIEIPEDPPRFGVKQSVRSYNPGWQNLCPWIRAASPEPQLLSTWARRSAAVLGLLLFGQFLYYVETQNTLTLIQTIAYITLTTLSALCWGALADGRAWAIGASLLLAGVGMALSFVLWPTTLIQILSLGILLQSFYHYARSR